MLIGINLRYKRGLYILSYDRFGIRNILLDTLSKADPNMEYCITEVDDQDDIRFFETWIPKNLPKFGKSAIRANVSPLEALRDAPQGASLSSNDDTFFLLTGKTIEKDEIRRGCPTPIKISIREKRGSEWDSAHLADYILSLCLMGRASGHMTRLPMPLYYLHMYAQYYNQFGVPKHEGIKQRIFYI
jgi:hypothetical protein